MTWLCRACGWAERWWKHRCSLCGANLPGFTKPSVKR